MKPLLLRVSCQKESAKWSSFKHKVCDQIIICGDRNLKTNYKLEKNILYLKCRDTYDALPQKMVAAFNAVLDIPKFKDVDRFIKLDSDNKIRSSFRPYKDQVIASNDYIGQKVWWMKNNENPRGYHFGRVPKDSYWNNRKYTGKMKPYADGGCSYILSRKAVKEITKQYGFNKLEQVYRDHIYEDMMVGLLLNKVGITPVKHYYFIVGDKKVT